VDRNLPAWLDKCIKLHEKHEKKHVQDCVPDVKCFYAFLSILERTRRPAIASHVIHFMYGFRHIPCPGHILAGTVLRGELGEEKCSEAMFFYV